MPLADVWSKFLAWVNTIIVPDWGGLISLLPFLLILLILGPILTLLVVAWIWHGVHHRSGKARLARIEVQSADRDAAGAPIVPANVPFCPRDALIFPPGDRVCSVCRDELSVRCPVDATVRPVGRQLCTACGTRYILGRKPTLVARRAGPPSGGAAAA